MTIDFILQIGSEEGKVEILQEFWKKDRRGEEKESSNNTLK